MDAVLIAKNIEEVGGSLQLLSCQFQQLVSL
jgi:hypothetical protein